MRIVILGSGGVGGFFGARLAASGADVTFVARGAHLEALRDRGLRVLSPQGDLHVPHVHATDDPSTIGAVDIVFFTVKLYGTEPALRMLPPLIGPETLVVPFQNGVDSLETLAGAVGHNHVAGGTAYISAVIAEPGVIRHTALGLLIFGLPDGRRSPLLEALLDACKKAGIQATLSDQIMVDIWAKFARLTAFSGMTALTRSPIGIVREDPDLLAMMQAAVRETVAVGRARRIVLPDSLYDDIGAGFAALPANAKSSMLEDLERGRPLELPWLSGAVVRIGKEDGIQTPTHQLIVTLLKPHVHGTP